MNDEAPDGASVRDAARALYEATPSATFDSVAADFGVCARTLKRWSAGAGGWQKASGGYEITAKAHAVADRIAKAVEQAGPSEEEQQAAAHAARIEEAVDERAKVLTKHRSEWNVVRALAGEAVRSRDPSKAKLAVDVGRALELAQRGERRAWGLDVFPADQPQGVTVVIERE
jgi:hypothetical protein